MGAKNNDGSAWLSVLAVALGAAILLGAWLWTEKARYNDARQYYSQSSIEHSETLRSDDDLRSQQEMADWAFVVALVSSISVVMSLAGVGLVYATFRKTAEAVVVANRTADEASSSNAQAARASIASHRASEAATEANIIAREQGKQDMRPWVMLTVADFGPVAVEDGGNKITFSLSFTAHNAGRTPATAINFRAHAYPASGMLYPRMWIDKMVQELNQFIEKEQTEPALGWLAMPNSYATENKLCVFGPDDLTIIPEASQTDFRAILICAAIYRDVSEAKYHISMRSYMLRHVRPDPYPDRTGGTGITTLAEHPACNYAS